MKIFRLFLNIFIAGFVLAACNYKPYTTMTDAVRFGDKKAVKYYIKHGELSLNQKDESGQPLIKLAIINARLDSKKSIVMLNYLIEKGVDVNAKNNNGYTALMDATFIGNTEIMKILIKSGADVNAKNNNGATALMLAQNKETATILIKAGAHINTKDDYGWTALMEAAESGKTEVVDVLIKAGADVNDRRKDGYTALILASEKGFTPIVKNLIEAGADVNIITAFGYGYTALAAAKKEHHTDVINILKQAGAK